MQKKPDLAQLADQIMLEKGLQFEFTEEELEQLSQINSPAQKSPEHIDLRSLTWCSIDPTGHAQTSSFRTGLACQ